MKHKTSILTGAIILAIAALLMAVMIQAGSFKPPAAPAPTMKTLDEIPPTWSQILPASERFELVINDEAVLDKETGLVWEQSPSISTFTWEAAINHCISDYVVGGRQVWHLTTIGRLLPSMKIIYVNVVTFRSAFYS